MERLAAMEPARAAADRRLIAATASECVAHSPVFSGGCRAGSTIRLQQRPH